jgi:hypothetical protein
LFVWGDVLGDWLLSLLAVVAFFVAPLAFRLALMFDWVGRMFDWVGGDEAPPQLPAHVEAAARERFNARPPQGTEPNRGRARRAGDDGPRSLDAPTV